MAALDPDRPVFHGLEVYRDLTHRFSLLHPTGWQFHPLPTQDPPAGTAESAGMAKPDQHSVKPGSRQRRGGQRERRAIGLPDPAEPESFVLLQSRRLRTRIAPGDLDDLREGMRDGLASLPDARIESLEGQAVGPLVTLEAHHTFRDGDVTRRRWTRLLYQGTTQLSLTAQGATEARFAYWRPMFNTVMRTVQFADWWADMIGSSWKTRAYKVPRSRP
jgi:hypothetical protein